VAINDAVPLEAIRGDGTAKVK